MHPNYLERRHYKIANPTEIELIEGIITKSQTELNKTIRSRIFDIKSTKTCIINLIRSKAAAEISRDIKKTNRREVIKTS